MTSPGRPAPDPLFGNALLLSVISAGVQLSQIPDFGRGFAGPRAGDILGGAVGLRAAFGRGPVRP